MRTRCAWRLVLAPALSRSSPLGALQVAPQLPSQFGTDLGGLWGGHSSGATLRTSLPFLATCQLPGGAAFTTEGAVAAPRPQAIAAAGSGRFVALGDRVAPEQPQSTPCTADPPTEGAAGAWQDWSPPPPPPLLPNARRNRWRPCACRWRDWAAYDVADREWCHERAWEHWGCPVWLSTPYLSPPLSEGPLGQGCWVDIPWRQVCSVSSIKAVRVAACLSAHIWATIDLAGRTRRQLRA